MSQIRQSKILKRGTCLLSSADRVLFVRKRESVLGESVISVFQLRGMSFLSSHTLLPFTPSEILPNLNGLEFMSERLARVIGEKTLPYYNCNILICLSICGYLIKQTGGFFLSLFVSHKQSIYIRAIWSNILGTLLLSTIYSYILTGTNLKWQHFCTRPRLLFRMVLIINFIRKKSREDIVEEAGWIQFIYPRGIFDHTLASTQVDAKTSWQQLLKDPKHLRK